MPVSDSNKMSGSRNQIETTVRDQLVRLVAVAIVAFAFSGVVQTVRSISVQSELRREQLDILGRIMSEAVAQQAYVPLLTEDADAISKLVDETRAANLDVAAVAVVSRSGRIVAASPSGYAFGDRSLSRQPSVATAFSMGAQQDLRQFVAPVANGSEAPDHFAHVVLDGTRTAQAISELRTSSIGMSVLVSVLVFAVLLFFVRRILREVREVAAGIRRTDEEVNGTVRELRSAAAEFLATANLTEDNAQNDTAAIDETRRTMQALLDGSNDIAERAEEVLNNAEHSARASGTIAERVNGLNEQTHRISKITQTIQAIAEKSDILALNASLEGVKAGEAGRSFVLVGVEMRRLAETVMDAVNEIEGLTTDMRQASQSTVLASEEGAKLAQMTTESARQITMISGQQRSGTMQVTGSMDEIQASTNQSLAGARQTSETASRLVKSAERLGALVDGDDVDRNR